MQGLKDSDHNFIDAQYFSNRHRIVAITEAKLCMLVEDRALRATFVLEEEPVIRVTFKSREEELREETSFDAQLTQVCSGKASFGSSKNIRFAESSDKANAKTKPETSSRRPVCLRVAGEHFAVGWSANGLVSLYDVRRGAEEKDPRAGVGPAKLFTLGEDPALCVRDLAFNANEESLVVATRLPVAQAKTKAEKRFLMQCSIVNVPQMEAMQARSLCPIRELLEKGNISGGIVAASLSFSKSHLATVGEDQTLRIWECSDHHRFIQTVATKYNCELYDVSLNPTATQIALGTSEGLKLCYVIATEEPKLAVYFSEKTCLTVQFSNSGHLLAAGFGSQVYIIDATTLERKYVLGPHRSAVLRVSWSENDSFVASACRAGSIVVWSSRFDVYLNLGEQSHLLNETDSAVLKALQANNKYEFARANIPIIGLIYDDEYDLLITLGADKVLEVLSDHAANQYFYHKFETETPTCVYLSKQLRILFVGLASGAVRTLLWPLRPKAASCDFHDFNLHTSEVTSIKVSHDLKYLMSTSKDGTMAVAKVVEIYEGIEGLQGSPELRRRKGDVARHRAHEILDTLCLTYRKGIRDKLGLIAKLQEDKKNAYDLGTEKEAFMRKLHEVEMQEILAEHARAMEESRAKYRRLQEQYESECKKSEAERHRLIEDNTSTLEHMDETNRKEQRTAFDINNRKVELVEKQRAEFRAQVDCIQKYLKEQLGNIEATYQGKYEELKAQHGELLDRIKTDGANFDEALEQCEVEHEKEIDSNKKVSAVNEKKAKMKLHELQKEQETLEKEIKDVNQEIGAIKEKRANSKELLVRAAQKKAAIDVKVKELEDHLSEQQAAILRRESEVKDMKARNSHLDNLKCILDYKIETLTGEKEPLEDQIKRLEQQVQKMHQDLEREAELKKKLDEEQRNYRTLMSEAEDRKRKKQREVELIRQKLLLLQHDLISAVQAPIDTWPPAFASITAKFFKQQPQYGENEDAPAFEAEYLQIKDELTLQKQWLATKLKSVNGVNTLKEQEKAVAVKMFEKGNTDLISDSNALRSEHEVLKCRVKTLQDKQRALTQLLSSIDKGGDVYSQVKKYMRPKLTRGAAKVGAETERRPRHSKRSVSIMNYYSRYINKSEEEGKRPSESRQIGKLFGSMQMNKQVLEAQNRDMENLQVWPVTQRVCRKRSASS